MTNLTREEILETVCAVLTDQLGAPSEKLTEDSLLVKDLDADSLDQVEIRMAIEEEFEIDIPSSEAEEFSYVKGQSVKSIVDFIEEKLKE